MPDFVITAPDGKKYKVSGPDHAGAVAALKKQLGLPIGPTKQAADIQAPFGQGTVFERPNALAQGGNNVSLRENFSDPLTMATGALGNYVDAAMLGGADEVLAGIRSLGPGTFSQELARLEQARRDYEAQNTGGGVAATGAGLVLNPLNLLGGEAISMGRTALGRTGNAAKYGGTIGGVSGLLGTEGDSGDRLLGAGLGAAGGALLGAAAQPGAELLGFGARKGAEGVRYGYNAIVNQAEAAKDPTSQAYKLLARSLIQDRVGPSADDLLPGQGLINLGGENVTALGRQATVAPGPTRAKAAEFFGEQAAGAPDRATDAVKALAPKGYYGTAQELDVARKTQAAPLYEQAYALPAVEVWTPRIAELMKRPSMKGAVLRAQKIAAEEGRNPKELGLDFNEAGDPVFLAGADKDGQIPSTQTMDYIKRGLDDVIEQYRDKTTGKLNLDTEGRAINNTLREYLGILKEGNPKYAEALAAYGGPSRSLDMLSSGRSLYQNRGNPAEPIMRFLDLTPQDQALVRIGFVRDAVNDLGNVGDSGSVYQRLFGNNNKRAVLQVLFPDEQSFNKFASQMKAEKAMLATNRTVQGGSATARIEADKSDMAMQGASEVINWAEAIKSGNPLRMFGLAMDKTQALQRGMTPQVADELGKILFMTNPQMIQNALQTARNLKAPAPLAALSGGWLRNTPFSPFLAQGSGMGGASIATPAQAGPR